MVNVGYPWWFLVPVLVVFAVLLWYLLGDRVGQTRLVTLVAVLAPACTLAAAAVAVAISTSLNPLLEGPVGSEDPAVRTERPAPASDRERDVPEPASETTGPAPPPADSPTASPTASPSASASASPAATASASASARAPR